MSTSAAAAIARETLAPTGASISSLSHLHLPPFALVSGDFVTSGGMDRANYALASYLASAGAMVHLVAHRAGDDLLAMPNVTFHRVPKPLNAYALGAPLLARAGWRVAEQLSPAGGRVVVNGGNCRWGDVNWVHYVHAAYEPRLAPGRGLLGRLRSAWSRRSSLAEERRSVQAARVVIANSHRTRRDVIERLAVPAERVKTVYYGIDASSFYPISPEQRHGLRAAQGWPVDRPVVAFVGALGDQRKGLDVALKAWRTLCREGASSWHAMLLVFGSGAQLPRLKRSIERDGLTDRVRLMGYRSDLADVLRACDALVSPTRYEAFGLGVLEALACGMPAFVSADAGVAELYPAELHHLLLPNPEDATDLAQRLRRWRAEGDRDATALHRLSESIRARSWDRMAEELLEAIGVASPVAETTSRGQSTP